MAASAEAKAKRWEFLEKMLLIRRFEEAVAQLSEAKAFPGHYHLYIGEEATGVGAIAALGAKDFIATTHRNHGHAVARGADPMAGLAEIMGREAGLNRGRGGSIHLCDPALGFLQTSGIVSSVVGLAVGGAYACKQRGEGQVTAAFFGDGALEEGFSFECMNIAALWKLPVVFLCENNSAEAWGQAKGGYPTLVHAANDLRAIAGALGIEAVRIEGVDAYAAFDAMADAVGRCRAGQGPIFIEAMTKRWAGSAPLWPELSTGVTDIGMATGETKIGDGPHREWYENRDPVLLLARQLVAEGAEARQRVVEIDHAVSARIAQARQAAVDSPYPAKATATDYVFAE
ncbi:MAG: thiamine pyrophosphate-dependent dehydrogenase E1 component subunit alpha [Candidatus Eiseniibacteriota bacterium]